MNGFDGCNNDWIRRMIRRKQNNILYRKSNYSHRSTPICIPLSSTIASIQSFSTVTNPRLEAVQPAAIAQAASQSIRLLSSLYHQFRPTIPCLLPSFSPLRIYYLHPSIHPIPFHQPLARLLSVRHSFFSRNPYRNPIGGGNVLCLLSLLTLPFFVVMCTHCCARLIII